MNFLLLRGCRLLIWLTFTLLSFQIFSLELTEEEKGWIQLNPEVTLGSDFAWAPYDFIDEQGVHSGISADIIRIIGQKTGIKFHLKSGIWDGVLNDMKTGGIDGLVCAVSTPDRENYLKFTTPYAEMPLAIIVQNDRKDIQSFADLSGKMVSVNKSSYVDEWLAKVHPEIKVMRTYSDVEAVNAVSFSKVDAYLGNIAVATYNIKNRYLTNLKIVAKVDGMETKTSIAISNSQPVLFSIIQKALTEITPLQLKNIRDKWFLYSQHNRVQLSPAEEEWIKLNPVVKVAGERDWAPFDFADKQNKYAGISNDYLQLLSEKTGLKFKVDIGTWDNNLEKISSGEIDLIPAAHKTAIREEYALFSKDYFESINYFFIRDDLKIKGINDLNGKILAIPKGYANIKTFNQQYPDVIIMETEDLTTAIEAVIEKRADFLYDNYAVLSYTLAESGINNIIPFKSSWKSGFQQLYMMTRKSAPHLLSIINKGFDAITFEEKRVIRNRWLSPRTEQDSILERIVSLTSEESRWINSHPEIRFSGAPSWLPFSRFSEDILFTGIVSDYLGMIEKKLPIDFKPVFFKSWQKALGSLDENKIEVISADVNNRKLIHDYQPIDYYLSSPVVIVKKSGSRFVSEISGLNREKSVLPAGFGYSEEIIEKYPEHQFNLVNTAEEALEKVAVGEFEAALVSLPVASYLIKTKGLNNLAIVGKTSVEMKLTLFVRNDLSLLHGLLNRAVKLVAREYGDEIFSHWSNVEFATRIDYWLVGKVILVCFFVLAVIIYWNLRLFKEVKHRKAVEIHLKNEKDNFQFLFDKSADGHLIIQNNRIVSCNGAALKILGLHKKEQLLNSIASDWSPQYQPDGELSLVKQERVINRCIKEGSCRFEWLQLHATGMPLWTDVVLTAIKHENQPAVYVSWRDISEQKALEEILKQNEEQVQALIDSVPLIIIVTSQKGDILSANKKALEDYQVDEDKLHGLKIEDFYQDPSDRDKIKDLLLQQGCINQKILPIRQFSGEIRSMMLSIISINYKNEKAFLTISVDMTERVETERLLNEAKQHAEHANQAKSEFLANMSHEIRTPMNAIIGFTELLNEQVKEPRLRAFIKTIQSAGNTLLMLINDILDLSKIEAGKMLIHNKAINIRDLFKEVSDIFAINIQRKQIDFLLDIDKELPHSILIDATRLRQILFNLLGNAVKFTEQGHIKLSIEAVNVDEHLSKVDLLIQVIDTGIGIAADQQKRIFNVFEQQSGQDVKKFGGTGLGLSITRRLVEMMGGDISTASQPGQGTTFTILLKKLDIASLQECAEIKLVEQDSKEIEFEQATLLIVDDVEHNRDLIKYNFEETNIRVLQAENGEVAVNMCENEAIDVVLMDIRMPVMDGYEATRLIKLNQPELPIIALTASVMLDEFERSKREMFDDYLRKPVLLKDLFSVLSQFLKHSSTEVINNVAKKIQLSDKTISSLPEIQHLLESDITVQYQQAVKNNSIEDIKCFATKVLALAEDFECAPLATYAAELLEKVQSFDIAGMQFLLSQFEALQQDLFTETL